MSIRKGLNKITILICLMCSSLWFMCDPVLVSAKVDLKKQYISNEFTRINKQYSIGEPFSKEDEEFVKKYAKPVPKKTPYHLKGWGFGDSGNVNYKKISGPIAGNLKGRIWTDLGFINHSFGAAFDTKVTRGNPTSIVNQLSYTAYGLLGKNGVGIIYSKTFSNTCRGKSCRTDESQNYSGFPAYTTLDVKSTVYYRGGAVTISSN